MRYSQDMDGLAVNFIHKRIRSGLAGFLGSGGSPGAALGGFLGSGGGTVAPTRAQRLAAQATPSQIAGTRTHVGHGHTSATAGHAWMTPELVGLSGGLVASDPCTWPAKVDPNTGQCRIFMGSEPGFDDPSTGAGAVTMGRFGAGMFPVADPVITRRCLRGMVLGLDGICYNKRDLTNKERFWPRGRPPLLTGGEMRCISVASRAAGKLERKEKQLRKMGMLKPLPKRTQARRAPSSRQGITVIDTE